MVELVDIIDVEPEWQTFHQVIMSKQKKVDTVEKDVWADFEGLPTVGELLKQDVPLNLDADPEFVAGYLKAQFVEDILKAMEIQGINNNQLAKKMGKSPQYVGRILKEKANFTLETLAEIACALGMKITVRLHSSHERKFVLPTGLMQDAVNNGKRRQAPRKKPAPKSSVKSKN